MPLFPFALPVEVETGSSDDGDDDGDDDDGDDDTFALYDETKDG